MTVASDASERGSVAIPRAAPGFLAKLLASQQVQATAARLGAWLAAIWDKPFRIGKKVLVVRHAHVVEAFVRDLDFLIAPINAKRIDEVNGPFVLGMDRDVTLASERRALYHALGHVDMAPLRRAVEDQAANAIKSAPAQIDVVSDYARPIAADTAKAIFGIGGSDKQTFEDVVRAVFNHTFLNLNNDKTVEDRAVRAAGLMRAWFTDEIAKRRASGKHGKDMMGFLLGDNTLDDDGVRRTLGGMLVGSIDTTATCVAKIVAVIGKDRHLAASVAADVNDEKRLAGWCAEALRRWPHNPIVLREAAASTYLAELAIRPGDSVILWTHAAMFDAGAFPDPQQLRPDRPAATYLHFGAGLHPCAGRAVNAFQIPMLVGALVRRGIKSVGPIEWAGPFPDRLVVQFDR